MTATWRALAVVLLVATTPAVVATPVGAQVQEGTVVGRPELVVAATDNHLSWGQETLEVFLSNSGVVTRGGPPEFERRVQTARNVRISIAEDELEPPLAGAIEVESGPVLAGSVPPGAAGPFAFRLEINDTLPPGTYRIPIEVTYDYSRFVEYSGNQAERAAESTETVVEEVTVVIENQPRFEVSAGQATAIPPGETDTYRFVVSNVGTEAATDARLVLQATSSSVFFGRRGNPQETQTLFFPRLAPGETRTVSIRVGVRNDTEPGVYPLTTVATYDDPAGVTERSGELVLGVQVGEPRRFAVRNVTGTLRVAATGTVSGEVVNLGRRAVPDAVVVFRPDSQALSPREFEVPVGTLEPNESAPFAFQVDVANRTQPGPRQVAFRVRYGSSGNRTESDRLLGAVAVAPRRDAFRVEPVANTVAVDGETVLVVNVTTLENETLTDVQAMLAVTDPFESDDPTSFVERLEPGETAQLRFDLETTNDAIPKTDSVALRFAYTDEMGERRTTDPYLVPVAVVQPTDGALPTIPAVVAIGVVALGVAWWWIRR